MRIPLPLSLLLAIVVPLGIWWLGVRKMDFLTPPSAAELAVIRNKTAVALSRLEKPQPKAISLAQAVNAAGAMSLPENKPEATVEIGDLNPNPGLSTYADLAPKGAQHLIELASLLETAGETARTLLAWERVLDAAQADPSQASAAVAAIKRLRATLPKRNLNPNGAIAIVIRASTDTPLASTLKSTLELAAHDLECASSGILKVTAKVTTKVTAKGTSKTSAKSSAKGAAKGSAKGKGVSKPEPSQVAICLSGPTDKSSSTETITFSASPEKNLQDEILRKIFRLASKRLEQNRVLPAITHAAADEAPLNALEFRITRLRWDDFGRSLNTPKPPNP